MEGGPAFAGARRRVQKCASRAGEGIFMVCEGPRAAGARGRADPTRVPEDPHLTRKKPAHPRGGRLILTGRG
mgnify:CR=1 FL=1